MSNLELACVWNSTVQTSAKADNDVFTSDLDDTGKPDETGRSAWEKLAFSIKPSLTSLPKKHEINMSTKTGNIEFERFVNNYIEDVLPAGYTKLSLDDIFSIARRFSLWIVKMFKFTEKDEVKEYYNQIYQIFYQNDSFKGYHRGLLNHNNVNIMKMHSGESFEMKANEKKEDIILYNNEFIYELTLLKTGINIVMSLFMLHKNQKFVKKQITTRDYELFNKLSDYINGYCCLNDLKIGNNFIDALNTCKNSINQGFIMKSTGENGETELNRFAFNRMRKSLSKFISPKGSMNIYQILGIVCGIRDVKKKNQIFNKIQDVELKLNEGITEANFGKVMSSPSICLEKCPYGKGDGCNCSLPKNIDGKNFRKCLNEINHMSNYHRDSKYLELNGKKFNGISLIIYPNNDVLPSKINKNHSLLNKYFNDWYSNSNEFRIELEDLCETSYELEDYKYLLNNIWKDWLFSDNNKYTNIKEKTNICLPKDILHYFIEHVKSLKPVNNSDDDDEYDNDNTDVKLIEYYDIRRNYGLKKSLQV